MFICCARRLNEIYTRYIMTKIHTIVYIYILLVFILIDRIVCVVLLATSPLMNIHNLKSALACAASVYHHTAHLPRRHAT